MLFNSLDFALFLPIFFVLYWFVTAKNLKLQNLLIVVASYIFYGWWDWRFLSLIFFSSLLDYTVGLALEKQENHTKRKLLLLVSITGNLGLLGFFKYYNFFIYNFSTAFSWFGIPINANSLNVILPVGISFYTFQTLSYGIDIYKRKMQPTRDFIAFSAFVTFFPQLVAGPIERATHLLPQFYTKRNFDYHKAKDGLKLILWGFFKKIVIADNCAEFANQIFNNSAQYNGSTLVIGAFFFTLQIYGDFSGYSDIAVGTSRLFGFDLMKNFNLPYFSRDIAEFWRRWHISLSTWFRDYLYIPLGGSKGSTFQKIRNTFIVFTVSGFWHGANWTFIAWGFLNAIYFLPLLLSGKNRANLDIAAKGKLLPSAREFLSIALTFTLTMLAWIFFRAADIYQAVAYIGTIFSSSLLTVPEVIPKKILLIILLFITAEWLGREQQHTLEFSHYKIPRGCRWCCYLLLIYTTVAFGAFKSTEFIYFAF